MTDAPPLLFTAMLGNLRPETAAARDTLAVLGNGARVSIEIKRANANRERLAFYWAMLAVAASNLADAVEGGLRPDDLHEIVKQKLGLGKWLQLPSGERVFRPASIAFGKMKEPERAAFINRVEALLCGWLKVPVGSVFEATKTEQAA